MATQFVFDLSIWPDSFVARVAAGWLAWVALVGLHQLVARRRRWLAAAVWGVLGLAGTILDDMPQGPLPPTAPWQLAAAVVFVLVAGTASGCGVSWFWERWMPGPARPDGAATP